MVSTIRKAATRALAALIIGAAVVSGCVAYAEPIYYAAWQPRYYGPHLVYYDAAGAPIYFVNGVLYDVPRSDPQYAALVRHYRLHAPAYRHWYYREGYRRIPVDSRHTFIHRR